MRIPTALALAAALFVPPAARAAEKTETIKIAGWHSKGDAYKTEVSVRAVKGAHYLAPLPVIPGAESLEVIISRKIAQGQPEVALGFTRALLKGMRYIDKHEDAALAIIAKAMNVPDAIEVARLAKTQVKVTDPYMEPKSSQIIYQALLETKKITTERVKSYDDFTQRFVDYSFLKKAEESLKGWEPKK